MSITVDTRTAPVNIEWNAGDTSGLTFRCLYAPDEPMDLAGTQVTAEARSTLGITEPLEIHIPDPKSGEFQLHGLGSLTPDIYDYDIQFNYPESVATYIHGRIRIWKDVTG